MKIPEAFHDHTVCVVGLGYVGLTLASVMAEVGFTVYGIEIREEVLGPLKRGKPHFYEPGLAEALERHLRNGSLIPSKFVPHGCPATTYIITVGTPLGPNHRVRLDMIERVTREVATHVRDGDMVILRSTVKLGTTRGLIKPILEETGKRVELAFCPERTLEGQALLELRSLPQIVGPVTFEASLRATRLFQFLTPTVVRVADPETAEMIKLVDNAQRDVQFAYANEIARLCDSAGVSAAEVIRMGKLGYARTNLPMPGPVGGPCLSKDPHILIESFEGYGVVPEITTAARTINERQPDEVADYLVRTLAGQNERKRIALLGLAFKGKPATDDLRGSMAVPIYRAIKARFPNSEFVGFDPIVPLDEIVRLELKPAERLEDAFDGAHVVVILNNHPIFESMPLETYAAKMAKPAIVYDFWNHFTGRPLALPPMVGYVALGSHGRGILPYRA
jgi:nucleotide sugar dehydrogenase